MCQAIGTCYTETRKSPLRTVIGNARRYILYHPDVKDEEVVKLVETQCRQNRIDTVDFLDYARDSLERAISLVTDTTESNAVRSLQKTYYEFYGTLLGAFGSIQN
jgi:regulator of PEP synthase PpsR (kinase-PPPase family)